ncbi:MAG: response regulator [Deltaproteobacteria bacterium]|nr:response regulator [Deltaproteobacteria bacterium]
MNPKILVVDDEENMLTLLSRVLGKEGYQVTGVPTGEEALIMAGKKKFDLAIVDVLMPEMDGLAVLIKLKKIDPELPVILMTAFPSWEKEKEARAAGCLDFLPKPLDLKQIKTLIKKNIKI